ncbi:MAG: amidohydrolase family protein [Chloroflexota bacterium]|nr:amidohydrolase [Dehalococcoidia bacterium]MDW8253224.1 amidohydrolase family protein [Chloroflexota bacterium]
MILDTQIHFWEAERPDRPWRPDRTPSLPFPFGPEHFLPLMDAAGVDRAIIVPPGIMGSDNRYALEVAARFPNRFAVMGLIDAQAPDIDQRVARWRLQPGMLGIRIHLHAAERATWPHEWALDPFWDACERYRVPVAVFVAGDVEVLRPILERFPTLKLIVDHLGLPQIDVSSVHPNLPALLALERFPNVAVKLSTLPSRSKRGYPFPDVHDLVRAVIETFGPRRCFFGSDHTQQLARKRATYHEEVDLFRVALPFLSDEDRTWILGRAAADYLGWPPDVPSTALARGGDLTC